MKITCTLDEYKVFQDTGNVSKIKDLENLLREMGVGDLSFHVEPSSLQSASAVIERWIRDSIGKSFDGDGVYGAQCKDYANAYAEWHGHPLRPSNAAETWDIEQDPFWIKVPYKKGIVPQTGDIVIWAPWKENQYGHIAVVLTASKNDFQSVDQNWIDSNLETGSPAAIVTHNYISPALLGYLRPQK